MVVNYRPAQLATNLLRVIKGIKTNLWISKNVNGTWTIRTHHGLDQIIGGAGKIGYIEPLRTT